MFPIGQICESKACGVNCCGIEFRSGDRSRGGQQWSTTVDTDGVQSLRAVFVAIDPRGQSQDIVDSTSEECFVVTCR